MKKNLFFEIFFLGMASLIFSCIPPPSGMVSWWGGDNDAIDIIGTNHGSPMNGATYKSGLVDYSFWFDGYNDYVKTNDSTDWDLGGNDFTIDAWIKTDTPYSTMRLVSSGSQEDGAYNLWAFGYGANPVWGSGNRLNFCYFNGYGYADFNSNELTIAQNTWYHIAVVRSGTQLVFYLNGLNVGAANIGNVSLGGGSTGLIIGARYSFNPSVIIEYAKGFIDEVEIFNRALGQTEINEIYNAGSFGKCKQQSGLCTNPPSGMVSWWTGDYNTLDMAGGHDGVLMNGAYFTTGKVNQTFGLDGVDDYIKTNDSPNWDLGNSDFTIDAWINTGTPSATMRLISAGSEQDGVLNLWAFGYGTNVLWGNGFRLNFAYYDAEGYPYSDFNSNEIYIQENTWYHIAVVRSGTELIFYFNGSYVGTAIIGNVSLGGGSTGLLIGARYETDPFDIIEFAQGLIDEVEIINHALSQDEIIQIYKAGAEGKCRPCATPPSSIVSWWKAENNAEDSIGTNNGTLMNGVTFEAGISGKSFGFDGLSQYVFINDSETLKPNNITIEGWINLSSTPSGSDDYFTIFDHQSANPWYGYILQINPSGKLQADVYANEFKTLSSSTSFVANQWYYIAVVYDGSYLRLFINGIEDIKIPLSGNINYSNTVNPTIGKRSIYDGYYFKGKIDELTLYNQGLTAQDIMSIYNSRSAGKCFYFPFAINKAGNAGGTITSNPSGINCGEVCSNNFRVYSNVTLNAQEEYNSYLSSWGGNCLGCGTNLQCNVFMDSSKSCTASFLKRTPSEASGGGNLMKAVKGDGTSIDITFTPANCATDHTIYWGQSPILGNLNWIDAECGYGNYSSISFDPGDPPEGSFYYFVIVGNNGEKEGSYGKNSSGIERPEATGLAGCDWQQDLNHPCQ